MRFDWADCNRRAAALARPTSRSDGALAGAVLDIVEHVRARGWDALVEQALRIDGAGPQLCEIAPLAAEARRSLPQSAQDAMQLSARNIELFHRATKPAGVEVDVAPGVSVAKLWRPLDRVGLYVPGGKASLFSTLLMLAIPARVAGVGTIVAVTPPRPGGGVGPALALAAELSGVSAIWTVGGAQAIAALAFGAGSIPAVDRICGPGNKWVAAAKSLVSSQPGGPGIDLPAGPSELMVIAGSDADAGTVAADLLSQAEHDADAQVLLVSPDIAMIAAVERAFADQAAGLGQVAPLRTIRCADLAQAIEIANLYAPEHLSLACADAAGRVADVRNAGAVFVGGAAAECFGDYLAGSSHVLPTDGAARFTGGVSTMTFMKAITVQRIDQGAAARLASPAAALARLEGLEAHARAADARAA